MVARKKIFASAHYTTLPGGVRADEISGNGVYGFKRCRQVWPKEMNFRSSELMTVSASHLRVFYNNILSKILQDKMKSSFETNDFLRVVLRLRAKND